MCVWPLEYVKLSATVVVGVVMVVLGYGGSKCSCCCVSRFRSRLPPVDRITDYKQLLGCVLGERGAECHGFSATER